MAPTKLLNLLALSSLAILACSFGPAPVQALSADHHNIARHVPRGHDAIAKRKRAANSSKRCKPRSSAPPSTHLAIATSTTVTPTTAPVTTHSADKPTSSKPAVTTKAAKPPATTPPASSPPISGGGSSKFGLAWPNGNDPSLNGFAKKGAPLYTWSPSVPSNAAKLGFNPIPMFWGPNQASDFQRLVVKGYANTVLGFNEPNQSGQSDISPQTGAALWQQYIQPLKSQGYRLGSPATTSAPSGKKWMQEFFAACNDCTVDFVAVHWYDVSPDAFIEYLKDFHTTFGKNIWVTEYACQNFNGGAQCTNDQVWSFTQKITAFMDSTDWVEHYFPFGAMHDMQGVNGLNQLMNSDGSPSALGSFYVNGN